jgi:hypothetical protein
VAYLGIMEKLIIPKRERRRMNLRRKIRIFFLAICIICVGLIPLIWSKTNCALKGPLPMDYEMSWVILTLFSMITLAYVQLTNRLRDLFLKKNSPEALRKKAAWAKVLLSWTGLVLFITILALTIRIVLLSFDPAAAEVVRQVAEGISCNKTSLVIEAVKCSDYFAISSFIIGSIMRFWLFLEAHWRDLGHFTKNYWNGI